MDTDDANKPPSPPASPPMPPQSRRLFDGTISPLTPSSFEEIQSCPCLESNCNLLSKQKSSCEHARFSNQYTFDASPKRPREEDEDKQTDKTPRGEKRLRLIEGRCQTSEDTTTHDSELDIEMEDAFKSFALDTPMTNTEMEEDIPDAFASKRKRDTAADEKHASKRAKTAESHAAFYSNETRNIAKSVGIPPAKTNRAGSFQDLNCGSKFVMEEEQGSRSKGTRNARLDQSPESERKRKGEEDGGICSKGYKKAKVEYELLFEEWDEHI
ncbi:uncharacterized protein LY89DRAFT_684400 [Mollisia scopiformis]|uniref:Uncharacterized protein n=1 Tax=Mollisia scopiformis TaxID=149040 RepID=A0A194XB05_MOLSC|nr:uncharacterized protein LY89DRAFT_684400 [Mollisia scopiformis]KUJ17324.1 hypothetical protein LY89DRAFT_684400 [Mollisia scopiformis]